MMQRRGTRDLLRRLTVRVKARHDEGAGRDRRLALSRGHLVAPSARASFCSCGDRALKPPTSGLFNGDGPTALPLAASCGVNATAPPAGTVSAPPEPTLELVVFTAPNAAGATPSPASPF